MDNMEALMKPREGWTFERGKDVPPMCPRWATASCT